MSRWLREVIGLLRACRGWTVPRRKYNDMSEAAVLAATLRQDLEGDRLERIACT